MQEKFAWLYNTKQSEINNYQKNKSYLIIYINTVRCKPLQWLLSALG